MEVWSGDIYHNNEVVRGIIYPAFDRPKTLTRARCSLGDN